ncbi:hypothetical protein GKQ77_13835 [Streptomyces sp. BG9H]|uniref:Uncharacterized protein n=1 Tax=Streptomyces anatolicus TaxID=2675858 RepID=A0ABS6YMJ2_9ACTN|nr:hypothetical protein [Streptomyces anatolicus]MBW5422630.1 hypothetical protein [Streptomyces anatolicus]
MTESSETQFHPRRWRANPYRLLFLMKIVLVLALLRCFAGPATKDFLGEAVLPMPTWEWTLCATSPVILICLARHPDDWAELSGERVMITGTLGIYAFYAVLGAIGLGSWLLWTAVGICLAGFAAMWHLNRKERLRAA